jgi:hypothetical protein
LYDDPSHYVKLINRLLSVSRRVVADQVIGEPLVDISEPPRAVFRWRTQGKIRLHSGDGVSVRDNRRFRMVKPSTILEFYSVDYKLLSANDRVVFRICTHGASLPGDKAAHIHFGDETLEEGDRRLKGQSLVGADFLLFFKYVCSYLDEGKLPWQ